jgi:CubicO group peptidase (beta-lactamase class C family)
MSRKKLYLIGIKSALLTAIVITLLSGGKSSEAEPPKKSDYPQLNRLISNEDSEIDELRALDKKIERYMAKWWIKGASLTITRNDSLIYAKGYGWADEEKGIEMQPGHIMRMASVSKLMTAVGIMVLQDRGLLNIKDTVFGPDGILCDSLYSSHIKDKKHYRITVEHLLRHQGGFYRDPVFSSRDVKHQMGLDHAPEKEDYFKLVLSHRLRYLPGSVHKYSNFGYILLSEIIERVSGKPYEQFMKEDVFAPAGCYDMHIAGTYYTDKRDNEVRYYTHEGDGKYIEEYNDSGIMVERCYGGNNIPLLSGAGAWCGSTLEIARLVACIDGQDEIPDIISKEAVRQMTQYFDKSTFSLGWNDTTPGLGWSRSGTLSGTCALVKRFPDGECWVMITNTSTWKGPRQAKYTDALFKECRKLYSKKLPARNLFDK